jgi:catechol 2,3-dioxygenase-like lactoylglutathione lyase family enzyme
MFKSTQAFSSFSVDDTAKARQFYSGTLGLEMKDEMMGLLSARLPSGARVLMYPRPDHKAASFTVLNFVVPNIDETVDELTSKGVKFEQYSGEIQTDAKGIARGAGPTVAWFKDPAGNILSVIQDEKAA